MSKSCKSTHKILGFLLVSPPSWLILSQLLSSTSFLLFECFLLVISNSWLKCRPWKIPDQFAKVFNISKLLGVWEISEFCGKSSDLNLNLGFNFTCCCTWIDQIGDHRLRMNVMVDPCDCPLRRMAFKDLFSRFIDKSITLQSASVQLHYYYNNHYFYNLKQRW